MKKLIAFSSASLLLSSLFSTQVHASGMDRQLDNIFNDMENYTAPGAYESQRRSSYFGGRYIYKTPVYNENLVSMELPSMRAGCHGIDAFGGSFSFVNAEQMVSLFRNVAANARGYAFSVAMDVMCPDCQKWMNELQSKVQALNSDLSNSCQLAQGLVNDSANLLGLKNKEENEFSLMGSLQGFGEDFGELTKHISTVDTVAERFFNADADEFNDRTGSVVYKAMFEHGLDDWFVGGDEELMETIMSMTGTVIVGGLKEGSEAEGETTEIWILPGNKITMIELIEGVDDKEIYDCSRDGTTDFCRIEASDTQEVDIEGLKGRILEAVIGNDGLIERIRSRDFNNDLAADQRSILAAMPQSIGSKLYELAPLSPEAAEQLVQNTIDIIALEYVNRLIQQSFTAVRAALANHESTYKTLAVDTMKESQELLNDEYQALVNKFGKVSEIEAHYSAIMANIQTPQYVNVSGHQSTVVE